MPMSIGQEEGFTKEEAIELAKSHCDYTYHFDENTMPVEWKLQPGVHAYLCFTDKELKKQKRKQKQEALEAEYVQ